MTMTMGENDNEWKVSAKVKTRRSFGLADDVKEEKKKRKYMIFFSFF